MRINQQRGAAVLIILGIILAGIVLLGAVYTWLTLSYNYSDGERAGYVQKFSHKGWICKTWEGDLALVNLPGQPAEIFTFSVRDDAVATQINALMGKRVSVSYEQHIGVPTNCFGETQYFVTAIRAVE
ncbi:6-phosphogluconate dehydrogenase [Uliginosibacterium flavum]|uniref:6-phosphogluconate dehydrogenase n=1 Tax=Uliginosibacterium flavum TaxID=1396831 RepID=A0ABV2TQS5_9RHOO